MRFWTALMIACAIAGAIARAQPAACPASESVVCLPAGGLQGLVDGDIVAFRGIPYAAPPVGPLRWRPPQPAAPWTGIRDARAFGPPCPQPAGRGEITGNEDCLLLNVSVPRRRGRQPLPVMIYLTGGGNFSQSGEGGGGANFVGTRLVPEGVVLVTLNIRLGALGFLTHPALDAENARGTSGNYGNQDHIAMLRWVQQNVAAFGGNPARVFLFGTSAGGASICGLMTSPLAKGLFHAVAMESSVPTGCEYLTKAQGQELTGARIASVLGCRNAPDVAQCLRSKSPRELVAAIPTTTNLFPRTYGPVVDGVVFPDQPVRMIASGAASRMPLIIGNNSDESASWLSDIGPLETPQQVRSAVARVLGDDAGAGVMSEYDVERFDSPRAAFIRASTDALFTCPTRRVARTLTAAGSGPVYRYLYTYRLEHTPDAAPGHSVEMPLLFQSWSTYTAGARDRGVSEQMIGWWTRLAKSGDPNAAGAVTWQSVGGSGSRYMQIDASPGMRDSDADTHCDFWDRTPLRSPHL
jgi:para-nitrobenzyl esterase